MIELIKQLIDFILHIDKHLLEIVTQYDTWTYLILFVIVFCETGLVVTPFLPGDSLLFAAGALAGGGSLNIGLIIIILLVASFSGDNTNYFIGRFLGQKIYDKDYKLIKQKYIDKTKAFYQKHGGKTLIIARFMPIIRTFAPFVAGVGNMKYARFISFSIIGNIAWVLAFSFAGYFFGTIPIVKRNFTIVIMVIILISLLPPVVAALKEKFKKA